MMTGSYRMEFVVGGGVVVNAGKLFDFAASERRIYHILILIFELRSFLGRSLQELVRRLIFAHLLQIHQNDACVYVKFRL